MKKLLFFFLIALIFGSISAGIENCSDVKSLLKKYNIYDQVVRLLNQGAKAAAQSVCKKVLSSGVCSTVIDKASKCLKKF